LNASLSIVLPVFDAEHRLAGQVAELLDVLPELTDRFEILIVDDGSYDDTFHVADELAICYPQVRFVRHPFRLGLAETIQTGLDHAKGELVLVGDEQFGLNIDDLRRLWAMREDHELVVVKQATASKSEKRKWFQRLWDSTPAAEGGSRPKTKWHSTSRQAFEEMREFERDQLDAIAHRVDRVSAARRPNILAKIKRFALDE
jgi:glycosyltransferase involved in cell wall biosynthesis